MIGVVLGSYEVVARIGEGGMGAVYLAEHQVIGRRAAVKVLLPQFSSATEMVERFFNEARAAARIHHPGIVDIFDVGFTEHGSAFLIMEFLVGQSLGDRISEVGRVSESVAVRFARQIASALTAAHEAGIIHRDLKPDNLILIRDEEVVAGERVKILDFGIAKLTDLGDGGATTRAGTVMGSPHYMSPEQCREARDVDGRADVYSLGCVLYHMVCGRPPFCGSSAGEVIGKQIYEQAPAPRTLVPELGEEIEHLVLRCLHKQPDDRFQSMAALVEALGALVGTTSEQVVATLHGPGESPAFPTTLTASSGVIQPAIASPEARPAFRIWLVASGVVIAAALGVVAIYALSTGGVGAGSPAPIAAASGTSMPVATAPAPEPDAAEPVAERSAAVTLRIVSQPSGAGVFDRVGNPLGQTPLEQSAPRAPAAISYRLRLSGYADETVALVPDQDRTEVVALRPLRTPRAPAARREEPLKQSPRQNPNPELKPTSDFGKTADPFKEAK